MDLVLCIHGDHMQSQNSRVYPQRLAASQPTPAMKNHYFLLQASHLECCFGSVILHLLKVSMSLTSMSLSPYTHVASCSHSRTKSTGVFKHSGREKRIPCVCVCVGGGIRMASIGTAFPAVYGFTLKLCQYNGALEPLL